jgi:hypothetical protein
VSGGAAFGYFLFNYKDSDPILSLITRNTFDPMETLCERLGIAQTVLQTTDPEKGQSNLLKVLDGGRPAIVWVDMYSLPYNGLPDNEKFWGMMPVVVYGTDNDKVYIADRSHTPFGVSVQDFARARARIKKDKFRVISLGPPDERKLVPAVQKGLWQCIRLYTEAPPKGARHNFGFAAYKRWAEMLTNRRNPQSWRRFFPPGSRLYAALAGFQAVPGMYGWICHWGAGNGAERGMYADFLDEAALLLNKPRLSTAAELFRLSQAAWRELSERALPEDIPVLKRTHELLDRRYEAFMHRGQAGLVEITQMNRELGEIRSVVAQDFPLKEDEITAFFQGMREAVLKIHDLEAQAAEAMQAAIA